MGKASIGAFVAVVIGVLLLLAILKIAIKLAFVAIILVGAAVVVLAAQKMIGNK